jgi:hypothetical protein
MLLPTLRFSGNDSLSCHARIIGVMSDRRQSKEYCFSDLDGEHAPTR